MQENIKIKISIGARELTAVLKNNAAARDLAARLPLELPMLNLYGRELCYRFEEALPVESQTGGNYAVGDIAYWPPRHSFVILYKQNGEAFSRQHLGHIDEDVSFLENSGDVTAVITQIK